MPAIILTASQLTSFAGDGIQFLFSVSCLPGPFPLPPLFTLLCLVYQPALFFKASKRELSLDLALLAHANELKVNLGAGN